MLYFCIINRYIFVLIIVNFKNIEYIYIFFYTYKMGAASSTNIIN